ncbi:alpha/beta fold hydrolase [Paenibacillus sp. tmac-D7]|uniref:alpha/beta fold hydrolase n=1 Tax=Paenibacillus sp. tmac-D7 TaxID=2591462 RepID=UPI0011413E41|nr:alpha/beta hydrolase [Paenibacillus sp. tmac-D7]
MATPQLTAIPIRDGHIAKVLVAGEGKPVVFLHGAGGLKWDSYLDELAKTYKVYAPFFPGLEGTSGSNELDLRNLWDVVLYYYDLFDLLGLERIDLIGHSFGGMLAAELAATDSRRVNNLLLICAAGLWNEDIPMPQASFPEDLYYDAQSPVAQAAMAVPEDPDERMKFFMDQQLAMAEANRYLWPIPDKGLRRRLHRIRANTCLVWGKHDKVIPVAYAYEFQKELPDSQIAVFEESSHFPQLEQLPEVLRTTLTLLAPERYEEVGSSS